MNFAACRGSNLLTPFTGVYARQNRQERLGAGVGVGYRLRSQKAWRREPSQVWGSNKKATLLC